MTEIWCFSFYAYLYWNWNHPRDKYQLHFLITAVLIALLPLPFLGVGFLIGVFCVVPRAILSALLISDFFHLGLKRRSRQGSRGVGGEMVSGEKV